MEIVISSYKACGNGYFRKLKNGNLYFYLEKSIFPVPETVISAIGKLYFLIKLLNPLSDKDFRANFNPYNSIIIDIKKNYYNRTGIKIAFFFLSLK